MILGPVLLIGLVVIHEYGHFLAARLNGVKVEEFGIFFPPKLWSRRMKKGYDFTINALPLGGFVKMKGEHDADKTPGSFGAASVKSKAKIMMAGVFMNLVVAIGLFTAIAAIGMPNLITKQTTGETQFTVASDTKVVKDVSNKGVVKIDQVVDGSPASQIGIVSGDQIMSINNQIITSPNNLSDLTQASAGDIVSVVYVHEGNEIKKTVRLSSEVPHLGVQAYSAEEGYKVTRSTWSAPIVAVGLSTQITKLTFVGLGRALSGLGYIVAGTLTHNTIERQAGQAQAGEQVSGPIGIIYILKNGAHEGFIFVLFIIALISLALAIMNVLPIPALDGGRLYMMLFSRKLLGRPLTKQAEEKIVGGSVVLIVMLFILVTIADIKRIF